MQIITPPSLQCQYVQLLSLQKKWQTGARCKVCNLRQAPSGSRGRISLFLIFYLFIYFGFSQNCACCHIEQHKSSLPAWLWLALKIDISARAGSAQIVFNLRHLDGKRLAAARLQEAKKGWCMCSVTHRLTGENCVKAKRRVRPVGRWADPAQPLRPDAHSGKRKP